jgi:LPS O-antigen subunit length determinant protein (WzzB/FepE family)
MNKSNDIEIDFIKIAKILIKEKTILLGTSLLIGIIALLYSLQLPKKYETTVILHKPSIYFFQNFINFYSKEDYEKFKNDYYSNFIDQVSSMTNISEFINNSSSYKIFKEKVEKNNVNLQSFFKNKFTETTQKESKNIKYSLVHGENIDGAQFLNEYMYYASKRQFDKNKESLIEALQIKLENQKILKENYIKNKKKELETLLLLNKFDLEHYITSRKKDLETQIFNLKLKIKEFSDRKTRSLEITLNNYEQALSVAKDIGLIETIPTSILSGNSGSVINEPVDLFYKGTKALSSEIRNIKDDFNNLKRTSTYNGLISQIEVANNQIQNLKKTTDYNKILEEREKIIYKLNNLKLSTEYNNFFEIENNIKNRINLLKELKLEWNPILELATNNDSKNYTIIYTPIGLLMGLLLAIVIIIFKNFRYSKIKY